jgi:GDP-D-mannose dehydratase
MLQQDEPDDYVVATGPSHSVSDFVRMAIFAGWAGPGQVCVSDPELYRPAEVHVLLGNPAKARAKLGWRPRTDFEGLLREMVASNCASLGIVVPLVRIAEARLSGSSFDRRAWRRGRPRQDEATAESG